MRNLTLLIPLLTLGWINPGASSPPARPWVGKDLDAVIQARFGHLTLEDIRTGPLGVSRVALPQPAHLARRFKAVGPVEGQALAGLEIEGWSASMYVLGREGALTGPILTGRDPLPAAPEVLKVRGVLAQGAVKAGKGLQDAFGGPIRWRRG